MDAQDMALVWHKVDAVDAAFKAEAGSLSGNELQDRAELTNGRLRQAWAIVRAALPERAA